MRYLVIRQCEADRIAAWNANSFFGFMVILTHSTKSILSKAEGLKTRAPRRIYAPSETGRISESLLPVVMVARCYRAPNLFPALSS
jgi:hypothetical protein